MATNQTHQFQWAVMVRERSCVIVVENLPVPFDRRVWQEAQALSEAGWRVSVICPANDKYPEFLEVIDHIAVYRHPLPLQARGRAAFLIEYAFALFYELRLLLRVQRERGFSVIQACNPPDLIFLVALPFKLMGKRFVFDQHDAAPELFVTKFGRKGFFYVALRICEWLTYKSADFVITANDSFRERAITRGGKRPETVASVYSIPDRRNIYRLSPGDDGARAGQRVILGYLGIVGDQDGVDHMVRAVKILIENLGFDDFHAVVVGDGPALATVRSLARDLGVEGKITFTGYLSGDALMRCLSAFDIGLIPDPINESNDHMSMNKVFEYSALGIPTVAYQLKETKRLLRDAGIYAEKSDPEGLARACLRLMLDETLRKECSAKATQLAATAFDWKNEAAKYVHAFQRVLEI